MDRLTGDYYNRNGCLLHERATNTIKNQQLIDKLAEYEILEEKGLLLKLPCNIGDTVYVVKNDEKQKCVIKSIVIENNRITYWYSQEKYFGEWKFTQDSVGKSVFLTEDEAEQKLNELKGAD